MAGTLGSTLMAAPASAALDTLTVTLLGGAQITLTVDVPAGTPVDQIKLPALPLPVIAVSLGPPAAGGPTQPGLAIGNAAPSSSSAPVAGGALSQLTSSTASTTTSASTQPGSSAPPSVLSQHTQRTTHGSAASSIVVLGSHSKHKSTPPANPLRLPDGLPTAVNPTLSDFTPGAAPVGLPDFFINNFSVPPALLPIFQAAGTMYHVPWPVLASICQIETDFGRDLSISSAGAEGVMQFLPAEWKIYGVDATGSGTRDPYNPVDAIFAAASYLHAAGASTNLRSAIYSYNHANWYVDSVLLRAQLIGGMPPQLVSAVTGLTQGTFPVADAASYADDVTEAAQMQASGKSAGDPAVAHSTGVNVYSKAGAPVVAVQDGEIIGMGRSKTKGLYIRLRDAYGNVYTYSGLKKLSTQYPVAKPVAPSATQISDDLNANGAAVAAAPAPTGPATAGSQPTVKAPAPTAPASVSAPAPAPVNDSLSGKQRLFANPGTAVALSQGSLTGLAAAAPGLPGSQSFNQYFTQVFGLSRNQVLLRPLTVGSQVIAGTILGRVGDVGQGDAPHILFQVRPAGPGAPLVDPKPILDDWVLLERTSLYRAKGLNPFTKASPTVGQVLLESKAQLEHQILSDPRVSIYTCGRRDIAAGSIDQRVLASIEYLSASGMSPTVSSLKCGHTLVGKNGQLSYFATGDGVDFSAFNGTSLDGHDGPGSVADLAVKRLLDLQGVFQPYEIVSNVAEGQNHLAVRKSGLNRVQVLYRPPYGLNKRLDAQLNAALKPSQWIQLVSRLGQIGSPNFSATPSGAAIPDAPSSTRH